MPKHRKTCPHCGATRFLKQDVVEIVSGKEVVIDTLYTCRNGFCQRVSTYQQLNEAVLVEAPAVEVELVE